MNLQTLIGQLGAWSTGKGPLYQKLARALTETIRNGTVSPGARLPSERILADALTLSRTSVVAAYDALREEGWLESRSGSGTWVSRRSSGVAAARSAAQAGALTGSSLLGLLAHHDDHDDLIDLALGAPPPLTELPPELFTLPEDEYSALVHDRLYYPLGLATLRQAIAGYYSKAGLETKPEQVLVTNGGQQAIALCAASYLQRGDSVLIEDPSYFGALDAFRASGARISSLPVEAAGVPPASLRDRITATSARLVYLTPTFQNPTGAVMPRAARKEIGRIVSEFGIPVIDDETLADLILEGSPPLPIGAYTPDAEVITIGSLSKLIWPGLRVGWLRASEPAIHRLARLKTTQDLGSPLITQAIAVRLIGAIDEARKLRRAQLKPRRDLLVGLLRKRLPEWTFRVPEGGLFLWVKLPSGDARELAQVSLRRGLVILPGPSMSAAEKHSRFLRLPFLAEPETLRTAVDRLSAAWRDYQRTDRPERRQNVAMV
jgi:DNA-binding transcriptional MocR family regulator